MKMLLIDVLNNDVKIVEANGLEDYYKWIGCSTIDIVRRKIGGITVEIVCDDEGTFVDQPKVSAVDISGKPCLYGNLLIAGGKIIDGELTELTEREIKHIKRYCLVPCRTAYYKEPFKVLYGMEY